MTGPVVWQRVGCIEFREHEAFVVGQVGDGLQPHVTVRAVGADPYHWLTFPAAQFAASVRELANRLNREKATQ